ncbi:thioesterase family protein [Lentilactobacillus sp. Marseille-Q4993]|uniref:acyl-CoA thioesterase n=1 Tax=Lentilactobacillus sp. Marseille-Q4993 TaxID=3039492 RepID=UPI0024BC11B8|nr:thioesterase family protein [Lentilactobacillus sp. Marseille-Q4993]
MTTYKHQVQYYETDRMQITHHSNYIRYMEEARTDFLNKIGWPFDKLEQQGITSPVASVTGKYIKPTDFPDVITITTEVEDVKVAKLTLKYQMKVDNVLVFEGKSEHGFLDKNGKIINIKRRIPEFYQALLATK